MQRYYILEVTLLDVASQSSFVNIMQFNLKMRDLQLSAIWIMIMWAIVFFFSSVHKSEPLHVSRATRTELGKAAFTAFTAFTAFIKKFATNMRQFGVAHEI